MVKVQGITKNAINDCITPEKIDKSPNNRHFLPCSERYPYLKARSGILKWDFIYFVLNAYDKEM
ncbi:MAG: hypothetical protein D8M56_21645 [Chloroflexi bacterium]|nr:hypothetical protein [Chloroflexota bacterium]